jgi:hypothetical protein
MNPVKETSARMVDKRWPERGGNRMKRAGWAARNREKEDRY